MINETGLKCVISGSFSKFKLDIDRTIEEFRDLGVKVLAPDPGGFLQPIHKVLRLGTDPFRPLVTEAGMSVIQIENVFLSAIMNCDFQYIEAPDGYVGKAVAFEIGFTMAQGLLSFSRQSLSPTLDLDPAWRVRISKIETLDPNSVVEKMLSKK